MNALCSTEGCGRFERLRRRLCNKCYHRLRSSGVFVAHVVPAVADRLAAGLERKPNGCLEWTGYTDPDGYGQIMIDGKPIRVHRLAWNLAHPEEPDPPVVRHFVCDNPPCADVAHLRPGTQAQNIADRTARYKTKTKGEQS